ncbi:MAG: flippase-like domain-containing protein [Candidatus Eisenbacteria bacterium]|uniref:Flippase-like domain-containing protein n=1 Tax=Eiseniibacteriota bacterium TaxID=2212470 RepID=A0A849SMZ2_UNCEI|nr:flippase-like domain-containing protein [Candidatus Eisenbacteria bacterium]
MSAPNGGPSRGAFVAIAIKLAISAALLWFLLGRIDPDQVRASLQAADPRWLAAALAMMFFSNVLGAYQWGRLLRAVDIRIPGWKVLAYYHVGLFFNNLLPANIGGDISRIADASRHGSTRTAALSAVLMDRLIGTVALAGLALVTSIPALDRFHMGVAYALVVAFFAASVSMLWVVFHPALVPVLDRLLSRVGLARLAPHLDDLAARLSLFRERRGLLLAMGGLALVTQISRICVHALVARALGIPVPFVYFLLFVPLLAVVVSLPLSFNGLGIREGAGVVLFGLIGVERAAAFSLQFTTYLVAVAVSLLGGLVFLVRMPRRRRG